MNSLNNMGLASNEAKEQRIMRLRNAFNKQEVVTVQAAAKNTGFTASTVRRWAKQGNIPLLDGDTGKSVVPMTDKNRPKWLL